MKNTSHAMRRFLGRLRRVLGVSIPVVFAACSSKSEPQTVPVTEFAKAFANAYCPSVSNCCTQAGLSTATCVTTLESLISNAQARQLANPKVVLDEVAAGQCLDAVSAAASACTDHSLGRDIMAACNNVFHGTVAIGGSCTSYSDCIASPNRYVGCDGVCTDLTTSFAIASVAPHATLGQACVGTCVSLSGASGCSGSGTSVSGVTSGCWVEDNLYCSNGVCVAAPAIGQACDDNSYCVDAGHCSNGTCVADTTAGACTWDKSCLSTSYCDTGTLLCTPLKANGSTCTYDWECLGGQCEQNSCRDWSFATQGDCGGFPEQTPLPAW